MDGKEEPIKIEPRLLIHDSSKDYGDVDSENLLIHGDNLLALKALEKDYAGQVKCIYIDPPCLIRWKWILDSGKSIQP